MFFRKRFLGVFLFVVAVLAVFAVLIEADIVVVVGVWLVFPFSNLRISTLLTILTCFLLVLFLQGKILWRPLYFAILAVIFFLALYEIVWYNLAVHYSGFEPRYFEFAALAGWVLLCVREVYPQKPSKLSIVLYGLYVVCMVLWVATGFQVNYLGSAELSITGEVFNVVSKAALGLAFAIHIGSKNGVRRKS
jgi:hypothetical protein